MQTALPLCYSSCGESEGPLGEQKARAALHVKRLHQWVCEGGFRDLNSGPLAPKRIIPLDQIPGMIQITDMYTAHSLAFLFSMEASFDHGVG